MKPCHFCQKPTDRMVRFGALTFDVPACEECDHNAPRNRGFRAFKLLRLRKDGSLGPLFINARQRIPIGRWLQAEPHERKGYAFRPGWHCTVEQKAPHLSTRGRVWCEVTVRSVVRYVRPESQGGTWLLAKFMRVERIIGGGGT